MAKRKMTLREIAKERGIDARVPPELQGKTVIRVRGSKLPPTPPSKRKG